MKHPPLVALTLAVAPTFGAALGRSLGMYYDADDQGRVT